MGYGAAMCPSRALNKRGGKRPGWLLRSREQRARHAGAADTFPQFQSDQAAGAGYAKSLKRSELPSPLAGYGTAGCLSEGQFYSVGGIDRDPQNKLNTECQADGTWKRLE